MFNKGKTEDHSDWVMVCDTAPSHDELATTPSLVILQQIGSLICSGEAFPLMSQKGPKVGHSDLVIVHNTAPCLDVLLHQFW